MTTPETPEQITARLAEIEEKRRHFQYRYADFAWLIATVRRLMKRVAELEAAVKRGTADGEEGR